MDSYQADLGLLALGSWLLANGSDDAIRAGPALPSQ